MQTNHSSILDAVVDVTLLRSPLAHSKSLEGQSLPNLRIGLRSGGMAPNLLPLGPAHFLQRQAVPRIGSSARNCRRSLGTMKNSLRKITFSCLLLASPATILACEEDTSSTNTLDDGGQIAPQNDATWYDAGTDANVVLDASSDQSNDAQSNDAQSNDAQSNDAQPNDAQSNDAQSTDAQPSDGSVNTAFAFCTELAAARNDTPVGTERLSSGDLVLRTNRLKPFMDTYEVRYLSSSGRVLEGKIQAKDAIDSCPPTAFEAYYITNTTAFRSEPSSASGCTIPAGTVFTASERHYDTRVSVSHAKYRLNSLLAGCSLGEGFLAVNDVAFVIAFPAQSAGRPVLTPTRKPVHQPDAGVDSSLAEAGTPANAGSDASSSDASTPTAKRCGIVGTAVTIDGKDAYTGYSLDERLNALSVLRTSGICEPGNRLGVDGASITLDYDNAFTLYDKQDRLQMLVRLATAGVGRPGDRCGMSGATITIDHEDAFTFYDAKLRADKIIKLVQGGICNPDQRIGVSGGTITIDEQSAFTYYDTETRLSKLLEITAAGIAKSGDRCAVSGADITLDGDSAFTYYSTEDRLATLILLTRERVCEPKQRLGVSGSDITIAKESAFTYYSTDKRLSQFIRLTQAGLGKLDNQCRVSGCEIFAGGNDMGCTYDTDQRVEDIIKLTTSGLCTN